jgi:predicted DNA-binding transcriptional regulator YafY
MLVLDCLNEKHAKLKTREVHARVVERLGRARTIKTTQRDLNCLKDAGAAGVDERSDGGHWFRKKLVVSLDRLGQLDANQAMNLVLLLEHGARFGMKEQVEGLAHIKHYAESVLLEATAENGWSSRTLTSTTRFVTLEPAAFDPELLKIIQTSLLSQRTISVSYRVPERGDALVGYVLGVRGLSFQDANIYVSCYVHEEHWPAGSEPDANQPRHKYESNGPRTLSVLQMHRVLSASVDLLDREVPGNYDINAPQVRRDLLSLYSQEPICLVLRIRFNLQKRLSENRLAPDQRIEPDGADHWRLTCGIHDGQGLRLWLLSNADQIEVIEPLGLREYMRETLSKALSAYASDDV